MSKRNHVEGKGQGGESVVSNLLRMKTGALGTCPNGPAAQVTFKLGGTATGQDYDQIIAAGATDMDGELSIEFTNAFEPTGADVFVLG